MRNAKPRHMLALLGRVAAHATPGRFALRDVCPTDATRFDNALDALVERGCVARAAEGCGRWHYRLTDAGRAALAAGKVPPAAGYAGNKSGVGGRDVRVAHTHLVNRKRAAPEDDR